MNEYESAAMWQLYSRVNEGVAIRSTFSRLTNSLLGVDTLPDDLKAEHAVVSVGLVEYIDYETQDLKTHIANTFAPVLHKRKSFEHEHEVRAVCHLRGNAIRRADQFCPLHSGIYVRCDVTQLIEAIYIAPIAPSYFREAVETVCARLDVALAVKQSNLSEKPLY